MLLRTPGYQSVDHFGAKYWNIDKSASVGVYVSVVRDPEAVWVAVWAWVLEP